FFYGLYDETNLCLTYVNAGHLPPLLFRPHSHRSNDVPVPGPSGDSGSYRPLHSEYCRILRLKSGGTVLGIFPEVQYRQECVRMLPGDILLIYSDGVSEAMNSQEEEYGEQRLSDLIAGNLHRDAADLRDLVLSRLSDHVGQSPQHDDLTLVVVKVEEAKTSTAAAGVRSATDAEL
ncbi:MAG TPA: PP2C family protein-serine/threonine phosphatase, partial [Acidobacteriota bacterium]|nr:PP2C family protein-serine/threonine phosphatase [Acidobacteriota bacterium]